MLLEKFNQKFVQKKIWSTKNNYKVKLIQNLEQNKNFPPKK